MSQASLQHRLERLTQMAARDQVLRSLSWLGGGELISRATRIVTTIVVARHLTSVELGVAAMAITAFEIVRAFAAGGIGQMVARASPGRLLATLAVASRTGRRVCLGLAGVQLTVGLAIAAWTGRPEMAALVGCLAGVFLLMPLGLPHCWLMIRDNRMARVAQIATTQSLADNLMTGALAVAGLGAWAIVLPKLLTVPLWIAGMRLSAGPLPDTAARAGEPVPAREVWRFAAPILGSDLLATARVSLDKVIVVAALGVEALGQYWFAVNAGLGLGTALTAALAASLFPVLAAAAGTPAEMLRRFDRALAVNVLPITLVVALQAAVAPVYVPLLFGPQWSHVGWLVAMICASTLTRPAADAAAQLLRAAGLPRHELAGATAVTVAQLGVFALLIGTGLDVAVAALSAVSCALNLAFAVWARSVVRAGVTRQGELAGPRSFPTDGGPRPASPGAT